jgi:hypothetical protein
VTGPTAAVVLCQTRLRAANLPVRAVEMPRVPPEATVSAHHASIETVPVPRGAQGFALVPFRVAGILYAREGFVAAEDAGELVRAAVDAVDIGAGCGVKVGSCHEQQGQGQGSGQDEFSHFQFPLVS